MVSHVIAVSRAHLTRGVPAHCLRCPVALALEQTLPVDAVEVFTHHVELTASVAGAAEVVVAYLPTDVVDTIKRIDNGDVVEPFEFTLQVDDVVAWSL